MAQKSFDIFLNEMTVSPLTSSQLLKSFLQNSQKFSELFGCVWNFLKFETFLKLLRNSAQKNIGYWCYHCFCCTEELKGKADIGPRLSKCCKSRYFNVYLHDVNHAISTEIFHEKKQLQHRTNKIPPWMAVYWILDITPGK